MNINFFNNDHILYPLRWLIIAAIGIAGTLAYFDFSGGRLFSTSDQEQTQNSSNSLYHK